MTVLTVGKRVPQKIFKNNPQGINLKDYQGQHMILYFYPRDNTPGCTKEAIAFNEAREEFAKRNCQIIGVSRDDAKSHDKFSDKYDLQFDLLSDVDEDLCQAFDVIKEKNMYGKKVMGIERSTFHIDAEGKLCHEWRKVKVPGHVDTVLDYLDARED